MRRIFGIAAMMMLLGACDAGGSGTLEVVVYGEEYIEEQIPAETFADGWTVTFDRFLVVVGGVTVAEGDSPVLEAPRFTVFDLSEGTGGAGQRVARSMVAAGAADATAYVIAPAEDIAGDAADAKQMKDGGYSVYVEGKASKGDVTKTFAWGWKTHTDYEGCMSTAQVEDGGTASVQLAIHGDHLFYDDLFATEPAVRFDLIAQADDDGDGDGEISQAELEAVDLRPLANYQVGSTDITDLWRFIEHQTTTLGHIDGEGHCEATRVG